MALVNKLPVNLWYALAITSNSWGEDKAKYLLKTGSSVPTFFSPALYNSFAIFSHSSLSGVWFVLLLHCNNDTNKSLKLPDVSRLTSSSNSLLYFSLYFFLILFIYYPGLEANISIKVSSFVPNPFIALWRLSASYSIGSVNKASIVFL